MLRKRLTDNKLKIDCILSTSGILLTLTLTPTMKVVYLDTTDNFTFKL